MSDATTTLQDIKGIGPATRSAILDDFPTLDAIDEATIAELQAVKGVGPATAKSIKAAAAKAQKDTAGKRTRKATENLGDTTRSAGREVADAAQDTAEGTVVEMREAGGRVGDQADNATVQVKAALTSIQNVITAALDAGKESLPEAQRQLKAAGTSLRKVGPTIIDAIETLRESDKRKR